jgi:hypothetical protein
MTMNTQAFILAGCVLVTAASLACSNTEAIETMPEGTEVTVVTQDGRIVRGKIAKVEPEVVTLTGDRGKARTTIARTSISEVKRVPAVEPEPAPAARIRTLTVPDHTQMDVELSTSLASDTSRVEDAVKARLSSPLVIDDVTVVPSGSTLFGTVTHVQESGRVKGVAELGIRFDRLQVGSITYDISTEPLSYRAATTKKDDAIKIGIGAAAGAAIGAIAGGKKGAAIGTAVGAGGGTAVVLATDGDEIRLASGQSLKVNLSEPLTIRLR